MKRFLRKIASIGLFLVIVLGIAYLVVSILMVKTVVQGDSMSPILEDGDVLMCNKVTYNFNPPERFDIVVVPAKDGTYIVKRVIGLPGERIKIDNFGKVEINDKILEDDKGIGYILDKGNAKDTITLGMDEFFVMGDNRNSSIDSRFDEVGPIRRSEFVGKVVFRIMPFDRTGKIE